MDKKEKQKFKNELYKLSVIKNSIALICFTILAIVFNHWWIVFFSILFTVTVEDKEEK